MIAAQMDSENSKFIVYTLGRFDVIKDGNSLVMSSSGSKKLWELYKFMLTHRDRSFTPETLMDQLWVSESYSDPRSTLRRQMHRLRQSLLEEDAKENFNTIHFTNGYYKWNELLEYEIDVDLFESLIRQGDVCTVTAPQNALGYYLEALSYYYGDYLPDCFDQHWVFPIRNHYRRLYLKTVLNAIGIMKVNQLHDDIITICQKAIQIDIYEESFHMHFMDALMNTGQQKQALEHYEHITGFYYHEMGLKPSVEMRTLYKKMLQSNKPIVNDSNLCEALEANIVLENAFYCEASVFGSIYELERRRSQRSGALFSIGVIDVTPIKSYSQSQENLRIVHLKQHLMEKLRKGDTFTLWSEFQFIVLLHGIESAIMEKVLRRILDTFPNNEAITISQIKQLEAQGRN